MVCSVLERNLQFDQSSETNAPRHLKLVSFLAFFLSFYLDLSTDIISAVCQQFSFTITYLYFIISADFVETFN